MRDVRVKIEEASVDDIPYIIGHSEARDWINAEEIIRHNIAIGFAWTGFVKAKYRGEEWVPACMWGLQPTTLAGDTAWLWLITTDLVDENPFLFVRHSQVMKQIVFKFYPIIEASVQEKNEKAKKWLRWLGADISHEVRNGVHRAVLRKAS